MGSGLGIAIKEFPDKPFLFSCYLRLKPSTSEPATFRFISPNSWSLTISNRFLGLSDRSLGAFFPFLQSKIITSEVEDFDERREIREHLSG